MAPDNAKYATGNTWSHTEEDSGPYGMTPTHPATTPANQHTRMSYKPNSIVRPLRNFIGERIDNPVEQRGTFADANPLEKATLGTMSWDNFHPSANVWLVMTTNHHRITTDPVVGPYSHKGATMTTLATASQYQWQGNTVKEEPQNYSSWRNDYSTYVGTDIRETQLERMIAYHASPGGTYRRRMYSPMIKLNTPGYLTIKRKEAVRAAQIASAKARRATAALNAGSRRRSQNLMNKFKRFK